MRLTSTLAKAGAAIAAGARPLSTLGMSIFIDRADARSMDRAAPVRSLESHGGGGGWG
jgi:hypothetical protein